MAKKYITPEINIVKLDMGSLMAAFSGGDRGGEYSTPDDSKADNSGYAGAKWGDIWVEE